ncbi:hypothetical protein HYV64_04120 [Candidatus Shapirobacteria bacterium]|nr:hypothetical protein [Candidatus Shapirobacteria bacterium]
MTIQKVEPTIELSVEAARSILAKSVEDLTRETLAKAKTLEVEKRQGVEDYRTYVVDCYKNDQDAIHHFEAENIWINGSLNFIEPESRFKHTPSSIQIEDEIAINEAKRIQGTIDSLSQVVAKRIGVFQEALDEKDYLTAYAQFRAMGTLIQEDPELQQMLETTIARDLVKNPVEILDKISATDPRWPPLSSPAEGMLSFTGHLAFRPEIDSTSANRLGQMGIIVEGQKQQQEVEIKDSLSMSGLLLRKGTEISQTVPGIDDNSRRLIRNRFSERIQDSLPEVGHPLNCVGLALSRLMTSNDWQLIPEAAQEQLKLELIGVIIDRTETFIDKKETDLSPLIEMITPLLGTAMPEPSNGQDLTHLSGGLLATTITKLSETNPQIIKAITEIIDQKSQKTKPVPPTAETIFETIPETKESVIITAKSIDSTVDQLDQVKSVPGIKDLNDILKRDSKNIVANQVRTLYWDTWRTIKISHGILGLGKESINRQKETNRIYALIGRLPEEPESEIKKIALKMVIHDISHY